MPTICHANTSYASHANNKHISKATSSCFIIISSMMVNTTTAHNLDGGCDIYRSQVAPPTMRNPLRLAKETVQDLEDPIIVSPPPYPGAVFTSRSPAGGSGDGGSARGSRDSGRGSGTSAPRDEPEEEVRPQSSSELGGQPSTAVAGGAAVLRDAPAVTPANDAPFVFEVHFAGRSAAETASGSIGCYSEAAVAPPHSMTQQETTTTKGPARPAELTFPEASAATAALSSSTASAWMPSMMMPVSLPIEILGRLAPFHLVAHLGDDGCRIVQIGPGLAHLLEGCVGPASSTLGLELADVFEVGNVLNCAVYIIVIDSGRPIASNQRLVGALS